MPDTLVTTPLIDEEPLITLLEAARLTGRPLRVIQSWTMGDSPVLPVARQEPTGRKRKWVRLTDLRATASRRKWGIKRRRPRTTATESGQQVILRGQVETDSRLPELVGKEG